LFFFVFKFIILGKVKTLFALSLEGNPLVHPPFEIIKQGIKVIQQYLRDKLSSDHELLLTSSSDDDDDDQSQIAKLIFPRKTKYFDINKTKVKLILTEFYLYRPYFYL